MSRRSNGSPRVHAELRLGQEVRCSRKRVERLMRQAGIAGIYRRRRGGCTKRDPSLEPSDDLVQRAFDPIEPDRLWEMDVTDHPTENGKAYLAVVLDAFPAASWAGPSPITCVPSSWSTLSRWPSGVGVHRRARQSPIRITGRPTRHGPSAEACAAPDCSVQWGRSATASTTPFAESFFGTLQLELLDEHHWENRQQLAQAIFEWIEAWYNPMRRHSYCQMLSPVDYEAAHAA
jgi:putative transposase